MKQMSVLSSFNHTQILHIEIWWRNYHLNMGLV